jgi:import inner membrane translocase subunit TIM13
MDGIGASGLSAFSNSDPKTQIMRQIQQESAMQNARQLVEVRTIFRTHRSQSIGKG